MSQALIKSSHLHRFYGNIHAVQDISLELQQGEILGLLGPNGAGKSTTMQMLSGVLAPSAGSISINGFDLLDNPRQAKNQLGYLPEIPPLYPELTVDEYLHYAARLRRIAKTEIKSAIDLAKQRCGLIKVGQRLIANLSKGYQQRVGIAQAIIHQPAVVILDEPTVGLDPIQIREIRQLIRELGEQHGVILSTHILPEVQAVCNRVQIINNGKLVFNERMDNIDNKQQQASISVAFKQPPTAGELQQLTGAQQIEQMSDNRFYLSGDLPEDIGERIAGASVNQHWGLMELTPSKQSLEQIFIELMSGDAASGEQAA